MTTTGYLAAEPDEADPRKPWDPPWRSRTAHRSCDPEAAAVLRNARRVRGWSVSEAARRSGVSRRMIGMLEGAQRRPSVSTAEALIDAYRLTGGDAELVWSIAVPLVGHDSPFKTGVEPGGW
ncbi:MAG: helix-turn-helix domain-containing protein [Streptosporangiaceae bacterium]